MIDKFKIEFNMEQNMCSNCKKSSTEYYELKLQVRFSYFEDIEKIRDEILKYIFDNFKYINKHEINDYGIDVYFANLGVLNKLSTVFNKKYLCLEKRSKKIVGRNSLDMKDIWRHTVLFNIINLKLGDHISLKGKKYYIKAFNKKDLVLRGLSDGSKKVVSYNIVEDYIQKLDTNERDVKNLDSSNSINNSDNTGNVNKDDNDDKRHHKNKNNLERN